MAKLQVAEISAAKTNAVLQVSEIEVTSPTPTSDNVLQVAGISATSANSTSGPPLSVIVLPVGTARSGTTVTMTATPGGDWTSIAWYQVEGPPTLLAGGDLVKSFVAPAVEAGVLLTFAVNAAGPSGDTTVFVDVPVGPHLYWYLDDSVWLPAYLELD